MPDLKPGHVYRGPFGGWFFTSNYKETDRGFLAKTRHPVANADELEKLYQHYQDEAVSDV